MSFFEVNGAAWIQVYNEARVLQIKRDDLCLWGLEFCENYQDAAEVATNHNAGKCPCLMFQPPVIGKKKEVN